jgi:hypothetical protein
MPIFSQPKPQFVPEKFKLEVDCRKMKQLIDEHTIVHINPEPFIPETSIIIQPRAEDAKESIEQRIERALKEKKTEAERISFINSPIDGTKQSAFQKKLNIIKYWEIVDTKIKKEKAPLLKNYRPLKVPDPKKGIKFVPHKKSFSHRTVTTNLRTTFYKSIENDKFWLKYHENVSKIFTLKENHNITRREFEK